MVATPSSASATSNQRMRSRNRFAAGKRRNRRKSTNPTWIARRIWAGTMA